MTWHRHKPKRIPGEKLTCIRDLVIATDYQCYVFYRHKAYHPKAIANWSLAQLSALCRNGMLRIAVPNPERDYEDRFFDWARYDGALRRIARERFIRAQAEHIQIL